MAKNYTIRGKLYLENPADFCIKTNKNFCGNENVAEVTNFVYYLSNLYSSF